MVALGGVRDAPPGEEAAPEKGRPAALLLHHGEVDVQGQALPGVVAQEVNDVVQLLPLGDLKNHLPRLPPAQIRLAVEPEVEGPLKQPGQPGGKVGILRDDPDLGRAEGVAVEQNAVGLRLGATAPLDRQTAELIFRIKGKGHLQNLLRGSLCKGRYHYSFR